MGISRPVIFCDAPSVWLGCNKGEGCAGIFRITWRIILTTIFGSPLGKLCRVFFLIRLRHNGPFVVGAHLSCERRRLVCRATSLAVCTSTHLSARHVREWVMRETVDLGRKNERGYQPGCQIFGDRPKFGNQML